MKTNAPVLLKNETNNRENKFLKKKEIIFCTCINMSSCICIIITVYKEIQLTYKCYLEIKGNGKIMSLFFR